MWAKPESRAESRQNAIFTTTKATSEAEAAVIIALLYML